MTLLLHYVTDTLDMALAASGCDQAMCATNRGCLATMAPATSRGSWRTIRGPTDEPCPGCPHASPDLGQDRALASEPQKPHPPGKLLPARRPRGPDRHLRRALQPPALSREPRQCNVSRRLLRRGIIRRRQRIKRKTIQHRRLQRRKIAA